MMRFFLTNLPINTINQSACPSLMVLNVRLTDNLTVFASNQNQTLFGILLIQIACKLKSKARMEG